MLGFSFLLLTVVFRSIVVPAKAIVMNLLSVGAAYGAIEIVPAGWPVVREMDCRYPPDFTQVHAIESWLPLFLFSILFGLSMDYHVFLLTRIREEYDKTWDNSEAVAHGLRTTAGSSPARPSSWSRCSPAFASGADRGAPGDGLRTRRRGVP